MLETFGIAFTGERRPRAAILRRSVCRRDDQSKMSKVSKMQGTIEGGEDVEGVTMEFNRWQQTFDRSKKSKNSKKSKVLGQF